MLRALATAVVLVALYYLLPLDHIKNVPLTLAAGLVILLAVIAWQLRAIVRAKEPGVRAIVALALTVPLFVLLFASVYFVMARASPANFSTHQLTRTDARYFTVTIFSTVGFGDITATSQGARLVVTAQMILDLLVLGLASARSSGPCNSAGSRRLRATDRVSRHSSHHSTAMVRRDRLADLTERC